MPHTAYGRTAGRWPRIAMFAGEHPWLWFAVYFAVTAALYQLALHVPLYTPFVVHPTAVDLAIPLVPWMAAPYLTYFFLMPTFIALTQGHPARGELRLAAALVVVGNLTLNIVVPTELATPLTPAEAAAAGDLLGLVVGNDMPRAVLPSGHLTLPIALTLLSFRARLSRRWIFVPWTLAIAAAILTTKQHYLPDALGALVWGTLGTLVASRIVKAPT